PSASAVALLARFSAFRDRYPAVEAFLVENQIAGGEGSSALLENVTQDAALVAAPILVEGLDRDSGQEEHLERWPFTDLARTLITMLLRNPHLPPIAYGPLAAARVATLHAVMGHRHLMDDAKGFQLLGTFVPAALVPGALGPGARESELTAD